MLRPVIDRTFKELQEKRKDQTTEAAARRMEERSVFLHQELMHRQRKAKTHSKTGDPGIAKMLGSSLPARSRQRESVRMPPRELKRLSFPLTSTNLSGFGRVKRRCWRSHGSVTANQPVQQIEPRSSRKMTAEQAKACLTAAGGDKDKGREAARKDGLGVLVAGPVRRTVQGDIQL
jgi:hypothetical protein